MAGAEQGRYIREDEVGFVGAVPLPALSLRAGAAVAREGVTLFRDGPLMKTMGDGPAGPERASEMAGAAFRVPSKRQAGTGGRFHGDQRIDGAARTQPQGDQQSILGGLVLAEMRQGFGFGAQKRRVPHPQLSPFEFRVRRIDDVEDALPVLDLTEVEAARDLVDEVVRGAGRYAMALCQRSDLTEIFAAFSEVAFEQRDAGQTVRETMLHE